MEADAALIKAGLPIMSYFPLAVGNLGRGVGPLTTIAQRHHATPAQVALAWLRARSPQTVLIPGTSSVAHLEENIASLPIQLDAQEQRELAESSEIASLKFPCLSAFAGDSQTRLLIFPGGECSQFGHLAPPCSGVPHVTEATTCRGRIPSW